jgi:hypothetical protein
MDAYTTNLRRPRTADSPSIASTRTGRSGIIPPCPPTP